MGHLYHDGQHGIVRVMLRPDDTPASSRFVLELDGARLYLNAEEAERVGRELQALCEELGAV